jgi:hypothetical protein
VVVSVVFILVVSFSVGLGWVGLMVISVAAHFTVGRVGG